MGGCFQNGNDHFFVYFLKNICRIKYFDLSLHYQNKKQVSQLNNKDMTQQEFTSRTGVEVTSFEFNSINEVYMNSEVDKDEFCRLWKKMNPSRVARAKAAKEEAEKNMQIRERVMDIIERSCKLDYCADAMTSLKRKDVIFLENMGIDMYEGFGYKTCGSLRYELLKMYGMIA